jgi:gluconolactonase
LQACQIQPDRIIRLDKALDLIIPAEAQVEKVAGGFVFTEGPLWHPEGYLIFSDIPANRVYKTDGKPTVFLEKSGYTGKDSAKGEIGSNGLAWDAKGLLLLCQHGNRQVARLKADGTTEPVAAAYGGKRFNSPNDLIVRSDGTVFFTDPPWGLEKNSLQPKREIPFNGVYRVYQGEVYVIDSALSKPNGIALSPDEKTLYVADQKRTWTSYSLNEDGSVKSKKIFFDATAHKGKGYMDGMKVDTEGNVYATGPGGVLIFSPEGKHLGTIPLPEIPSNLAWGDADAKTLYATCQGSIYKVKLSIEGVRWAK